MSRSLALALVVGALFVSSAGAQTAAGGEMHQAVAPVSADAFAEASRRVVRTLELVNQVQGASPAMAVVMVRRGEAPTIWVHGPLDARAPAVAANADTPFYIASQTKAYVGLMALNLHARGIFSLDQSLSDVWPALTLPEGADPHAITFRQLLSHQGNVENETLEYRTSNTDRVPVRDYPRLLSTYSTSREPGFAYRNLGYLIYAAALEQKTGRDWRSWLDAEILRPAGLVNTSSRASRFSRTELPVYHQWLGDTNWGVFQTKDDAVMHAAGGLVSSPRDMARWLSLQLGEISGVVSPDVLAQSHAIQIAAEIPNDVLNCQGYAVGWNICRIGAVDVLAHGGQYTAVRSIMAVSPELGVGFAFMSNSDSMTGALSQVLTQIFFVVAQDPSWNEYPPEAVQGQYQAFLGGLLQERRATVAQVRGEAQWEDWAWRPANAELRRYVGRYRSARFGDIRVTLTRGVLHAQRGVMGSDLEPAKLDLFGFSTSEIEPPMPLAFERNGRRATALTWNGERFERTR